MTVFWFSIVLAIGIGLVASAVNRWPLEIPHDAAERARFKPVLLGKALKALGGSTLATLSIAAILATLLPIVHWPVWAAGALLIWAALIIAPEEPRPGTVRLERAARSAALTPVAMLGAALILLLLGAGGRASLSQVLFGGGLLLVAAGLQRLATRALGDLVEISTLTPP